MALPHGGTTHSHLTSDKEKLKAPGKAHTVKLPSKYLVEFSEKPHVTICAGTAPPASARMSPDVQAGAWGWSWEPEKCNPDPTRLPPPRALEAGGGFPFPPRQSAEQDPGPGHRAAAFTVTRTRPALHAVRPRTHARTPHHTTPRWVCTPSTGSLDAQKCTESKQMGRPPAA